MAGMNHWKAHRRTHILVAVFWFVTIAHSPAQKPHAGQVSGHVIDAMGATIPRASVFVRKNTPFEEDVNLLAHTDMHGDFSLVLPEGGYDILITSPGFAATVETLPVIAGKRKRVEWKLKALGCEFPGVNCDTFQ